MFYLTHGYTVDKRDDVMEEFNSEHELMEFINLHGTHPEWQFRAFEGKPLKFTCTKHEGGFEYFYRLDRDD